ncbi:hypothetical protein RZS08_12655, partial [Arthrospira platensis SPKY1]|nr:hypothetical protein [Arthrospira platensis SPKY1]
MVLVSGACLGARASEQEQVSFSLVRLAQERSFYAGRYQPIIEGRFNIQVTFNGQTISQYQFSPGAALGIASTVAFVADQRGQAFILEGDTDSLKNGQCIMYLRSGGVVRHWALMALHNCLE